MLSEQKNDLSREKRETELFAQSERPRLATFATMRIKYRKVGNMQYISHLDLQRTWMRVLVRAGIPLWYTQGFNPHPKLNYGCPLPVGTQSACEYLDIRIDREITPQEIQDRLNAELPETMRVLEVYSSDSSFSDIALARYKITLHPRNATEKDAAAIDALLHGAPILMTKKSKAGNREIDILSYVQSCAVAFCPEEASIVISAVLAAGNTANLNAEMLVTAIKRELGLFAEVNTWEYYDIMREELLCADGERFH